LAVGLSALTPSVHDTQWHDCDRMTAAYQRLAPSARPLSELFGQIDVEFADIAPILKLPTPNRTLQSYFEPAPTATA